MKLYPPIMVQAQHNRRKCRICGETVCKGELAIRYDASVWKYYVSSGDAHISCWIDFNDNEIDDKFLKDYHNTKLRKIMPMFKARFRRKFNKEKFVREL